MVQENQEEEEEDTLKQNCIPQLLPYMELYPRTTPGHTVLHCVTLCYSVLYCVSLCFTVLHCVTLCYTQVWPSVPHGVAWDTIPCNEGAEI